MMVQRDLRKAQVSHQPSNCGAKGDPQSLQRILSSTCSTPESASKIWKKADVYAVTHLSDNSTMCHLDQKKLVQTKAPALVLKMSYFCKSTDLTDCS